MRLGLLFRLCVLWGLVVATSSSSSSSARAGKKKTAGRRSRQAFDSAEAVEGVWSDWGEWSECSQPCGVGVSERSRNCLSPPPPQTPSLSHSPPNWGGYIPGGGGGPVISAMRPFYPSRYPGEHPPYYPPSNPANQSPGLPLYRDMVAGVGPGPGPGPRPGPGPVQGSPPVSPGSFYQPDYSQTNQDPAAPVYRSPYHANPRGHNQPGRVMRRPTNQGAQRAGGGGSRRSVATNQDGATSSRRTGAIRPGQFGYGRVPFSLPLHRPNRQARHAANGTELAPTPAPGRAPGGQEAGGPAEGEDQAAAAAAEELKQEEEALGRQPQEVPPTATAAEDVPDRPRPQPQRHLDPLHRGAEGGRGRGQELGPPPHHSFSPASRASFAPLPAQGRQPFDWHSLGAPPPPAAANPPFPQPRAHHDNSPPPFSSPLHRPPTHLQREREQHPGAHLAQGGVYPLQHAQGERRAPHSYSCPGTKREIRRCSSQVCAGSPPDPRAEQCAAFNTHEFMGRLYDWEPFTEVGLDKQCELTCRPVGYRFYVRQAEQVRDGTPCLNLTTNDLCVGGRCLSEGCDGVLGSGVVIDRCGVCGGGEHTCRKVSGSFRNTTVPLGYHKILDIPAGATFINITERLSSPNYLAMRSGTGVSVVNGRWAVDPPGEYQAGGTSFTYARPNTQIEGQEETGETLTAPGPTTTQLQLYIIFHRQNPGIDYEYHLPVERAEREREKPREREREREREPARERPREREGLWEGASSPLRSAGSITVSLEEPARHPVSVPLFPSSSSSSSSSSHGWSPEVSRPRGSAPHRNPRIPPRTDLPLDTQSPFVWRRGELTECSASCGKGSQHRVILCINRFTDQEESDRKCDSATKPGPEDEPCNVQHCPPFWEASGWSECSVSCGPGVQQRQLQCRQRFGNRSTMVQPQRCAALTPPQASQACQLSPCSHWEVGSDWGSCSVDCGVGRRLRSVRCVSDHGNEVHDKECHSRPRPEGSEDCNMGPCVTNWYFTGWANTCSAPCGPGVQKREVLCLSHGGGKDGGGGGDCVGDKPAEMKACNTGVCKPTRMWYSSPWTQCNVACGNGTQRRDIICVQKMGSDITVAPAGQCAEQAKPVAVQQCEMGACKAQWFTTEWSACSRSCGKGLQMREVRCLTVDKQYSQECDFSPKPEQEQFCNTIPCGPQVTDENCRDRRSNCMMVVQARLCVYSYYKTACCASCTHNAQRTKRH
ncbi:unnamed protein product [Arctogadus glacialis]